MAVISMKQLLEAGVHFGHQTRRWNPKMAKYIFTERNGIHVIDLQQTVKMADAAYEFVRDAAANDAVILFVGTKNKLLMLLKKKQNVLVNTTSTTVGWVELLQTGILSKNVSLVWKKSNVWKKMELLKFFLRKKLLFLTNNVLVLKNSWVVSKICLVSQT